MTGNGSGATTVLRAHGVLLGILNDAVKLRRLAVNPAAGLENLPEKSSRSHIYLNADDVHRLAAEAGEHGPLVYLLAPGKVWKIWCSPATASTFPGRSQQGDGSPGR